MTVPLHRLLRQSSSTALAAGLAGLSAIALATHMAAAQNGGPSGGGARIDVLSSRPDLVTGSDALVHIAIASPAPPRLRVLSNGADVTSRFRPDQTRSGLTALLTNLRAGSNQIDLSADGLRPASAHLVAYPIAGPVISGPHEQPFTCETEGFKLQGGATLGAALDANCSVATRVDYVYRLTSQDRWMPLPDRSAAPTDAARVTKIGRASCRERVYVLV